MDTIQNVPEEMPLLTAEGLSKRYKNVEALLPLDIQLPYGKIIGLLGPNGSGKTTLIKLIAGLLKKSGGKVTVNGCPIGAGSKIAVSYLPERNSLPLYMKPNEIIEYFKEFFPDFDEERCRGMLSDLQVPFDRPISTFSKGMKEKIQLIMVMSRHAKLYLLDEPIAGVDPAARDYILETVIKNKDPEATLLISTHLISDIEDVLDEFIFIKNGRAVRYDSVQNVHNEGKTVDGLFREVFKW